MKAIKSLVVGAIGIVIALLLVPSMNKTIATITTPSYSSGVAAMSPVVLVVFFAAIIFVVLGLVNVGGNSDNVTVKITKNKKDFVIRIEKASRSLGQYINNLDELLGITTVENEQTDGLILNERNQLNTGLNYHWYLVDKHPDMNMFKVVGLHKEDATKNKVFILGNYNGNPYLKEIGQEYVNEVTMQQCLSVAGIK